MSKVRVLVGTRKGAFVLSSDASRKKWKVDGPQFAGWEIFHLKGSPAEPRSALRLPVQRLVRPGDASLRRWRQDMGDGRQPVRVRGRGRPAHLVRRLATSVRVQAVWHLEPSLNDPDTVYAGVEDAAIFKSSDAGQTWNELPGLATHQTAAGWAPGAGGLCLHTILIDPSNPSRIFVAISAAGAFRSDDAGKTWRPINHGLRFQPHSRP